MQLVCPECGHPLEDVAEPKGTRCPACNEVWPVIAGIPRFVEQEHLASFGLQWNRYEVAHDEEDRATFQAKTGVAPGDLKGLAVLDAGCGGGRYSKVAGEAGALVAAADHTGAVDKAAALCRHLPGVQFVQADLKKLPFPRASFDFVFSIGVMHHDVATRAVFDRVAQMVKPGGRLAVWLYRRNQWWQERLNDLVRRRTTRMAPESLGALVPAGGRAGSDSGGQQDAQQDHQFRAAHPVWENRLCDTFDWYAPRYQHHHTLVELETWFHEAGFSDLTVLPPEKAGRTYRWCYEHNLLIGSGVNVLGTKTA